MEDIVDDDNENENEEFDYKTDALQFSLKLIKDIESRTAYVLR